MGDAKCPFGFVDRREQIIVLAVDPSRRQLGDAFGVAIGPLRDHGEFRGDGGEVIGIHVDTLGLRLPCGPRGIAQALTTLL